ncbi:MAG: type IX secretion system protein PorQ [Saprospiraceae bacterium]|nr:type IX secretion system protein PorQ [Saprospiraceae bacterium]
MKIHLLPLFLGLTACLNLHAQIGGQYTYSFLTLSPSARVSALGGSMIAVSDDDVNLAYTNPSLLNADMHQQIGFSHGFLPAGIQYGYVAYGQHLSKMKATLHGGVQYVRYGDLDARNELNELEGSFKAAEYAVVAGIGYQAYDRLTLGANLKFITSNLASYTSSGLAADLAAAYNDTSGRTTISIVFKNLGSQLATYSPGDKEPLPFEVQLGLSRKLRYLPFRFSIIYQHLQRWNITYDDPNTKEEDPFFFGENPPSENETSVFFDNLFRHFIFNGEFLLGKKENLRLRIGYNHLMRKELSLENYRSLSGFTFGAGIKINRFRLDYGRTNYHLAGSLNHLSISTNLREFKRG